jgi:hypothetical protein
VATSVRSTLALGAAEEAPTFRWCLSDEHDDVGHSVIADWYAAGESCTGDDMPAGTLEAGDTLEASHDAQAGVVRRDLLLAWNTTPNVPGLIEGPLTTPPDGVVTRAWVRPART